MLVTKKNLIILFLFLFIPLAFAENSQINQLNKLFDSLSKTAYDEGFSYVLNSKKGGSVSAEMQNFEFDRTSPQNSLYVDMIK